MTGSTSRRRIARGFVVPIAVLIGFGAWMATVHGRASAEGFAGLVILAMLIVAIPVVLIGNTMLVPADGSDGALFTRGMILPALFMVAMVVYQSGLWDRGIEPLLPQRVDPIQPASSERIADRAFDFYFVVVNDGEAMPDQAAIERYAREDDQRASWADPENPTYEVHYYFVPQDLYDPVDPARSKEDAIAVFRRLGTEDASLTRIK